MEKLFTVAGTSNLNGVVKFRFANDLKSRIAVLERNGHTDILLQALPEPMTKERAIAFLEADAPAAPQPTAELTVDTLRTELAKDGELAEDMTEQFLAEVVARENQ
jgi:hypothetical protein